MTERLIAVEEHFMLPELLQAGQRYLAGPAAAGSGWREAGAALEDSDRARRGALTLDLGMGRINAMDAAGIDFAILSISTVANHQMLDGAQATPLARLANDQLAEAVVNHPDRFAGLAAIAPQDPEQAAAEIERAIQRLHLSGVVINSTRRASISTPAVAPIFEAAQDNGAPIYLHPSLLPAGAVGPTWTTGSWRQCGVRGRREPARTAHHPLGHAGSISGRAHPVLALAPGRPPRADARQDPP